MACVRERLGVENEQRLKLNNYWMHSFQLLVQLSRTSNFQRPDRQSGGLSLGHNFRRGSFVRLYAFLMPNDREDFGAAAGYNIRIQPFTPIQDGGGSDSGWRTPASMPLTPSADDSNGILFTPRRVMMMSFENLVALANHQERLKEARKMVWRDKGQPVVELDTLEQCLSHAISGGFRKFLFYLREQRFKKMFTGSATLAFVIRACLNVVLALSRIHRVPRCALHI